MRCAKCCISPLFNLPDNPMRNRDYPILQMGKMQLGGVGGLARNKRRASALQHPVPPLFAEQGSMTRWPVCLESNPRWLARELPASPPGSAGPVHALTGTPLCRVSCRGGSGHTRECEGRSQRGQRASLHPQNTSDLTPSAASFLLTHPLPGAPNSPSSTTLPVLRSQILPHFC